MSEQRSSSRDWWVIAGMSITAAAAAVSSFTGLRNLAVATGWPVLLAPLFPVCIDAYAATATRVWLAASESAAPARRFAKWNTVLAIGLSLIGNGAWHLLDAGLIKMSWVIIVLVGAVPPAVLGLLSHLAVLRTQTNPPTGVTSPKPEAMPSAARAARSGRRGGARRRAAAPATLDDARRADAEYRARHGQPITRDALRKQLHVSAMRASELLRQLKEQQPGESHSPTEAAQSVVNSTNDFLSPICDDIDSKRA